MQVGPVPTASQDQACQNLFLLFCRIKFEEHHIPTIVCLSTGDTKPPFLPSFFVANSFEHRVRLTFASSPPTIYLSLHPIFTSFLLFTQITDRIQPPFVTSLFFLFSSFPPCSCHGTVHTLSHPMALPLPVIRLAYFRRVYMLT